MLNFGGGCVVLCLTCCFYDWGVVVDVLRFAVAYLGCLGFWWLITLYLLLCWCFEFLTLDLRCDGFGCYDGCFVGKFC